MSRTKFVECKDRSFYVYDVALGVFLKHLIDAAEINSAKSRLLSEQIESWRVVACIQDIGLTTDEDWTEDQRKTFVSLAEFACATLQRRESIPATELLAWNILDGEGVFPRGATEVETGPIVELGRAIIALVSGDLPEAPKGYEWFYGTPSGRDVLRVREP